METYKNLKEKAQKPLIASNHSTALKKYIQDRLGSDRIFLFNTFCSVSAGDFMESLESQAHTFPKKVRVCFMKRFTQ